MKFFVTLHSDKKLVTETSDRMFYPHLHGPFETDMEARKAMAKLHPNDKEARFLLLDGIICSVPPSPLEKPEAEKRAPGNEANWTKREENGVTKWTCNTCQAVIMNARVAHPVHDGPFALSGGGECEYEDIGYCPNCERKPDFHGAPIKR